VQTECEHEKDGIEIDSLAHTHILTMNITDLKLSYAYVHNVKTAF